MQPTFSFSLAPRALEATAAAAAAIRKERRETVIGSGSECRATAIVPRVRRRRHRRVLSTQYSVLGTCLERFAGGLRTVVAWSPDHATTGVLNPTGSRSNRSSA